jgi:hypothetical protein
MSLPTAPSKNCFLPVPGAQEPRRPRFSFFRFNCQTAAEIFRSPTLRLPEERLKLKPPITLRSVFHYISDASFTAAPRRRCDQRVDGPSIGRALFRSQWRAEVGTTEFCAEYNAATLRNEKTGIAVSIPLLPPLYEVLDTGPTGDLVFICGANGKPRKSFSEMRSRNPAVPLA